MHSLVPVVRRGMALATLLVMFAAPAAYADEPVPVDPQNRVNPPGGLMSEEARINPPGKAPRVEPPTARIESHRRISPSFGAASQEPSWFELLTGWLRAHARIRSPMG